jgi:molybdopterin biosynthesis enzyme
VRSVEEQQARVTAAAVAPRPVRLPIAEAQGMMCAEEVVTEQPMPGFDQAAIDGYAVRAVDITTAEDSEIVLPVTGVIAAGSRTPSRLQPKQAARIETGAPMPTLADAVLPLRWSDGGQTKVRVLRGVRPGAYVRHVGDDVQPGDVAVRAGAIIGPAQVGLLAAVGRERVLVHPRPRVAVMSVGGELVDISRTPGNGQVYDVNSYALAAAARDAGADATRVGIAPGDPRRLRELVEARLLVSEAVLISGAAGGRSAELVVEALSDLGTLDLTRVAMQPGMLLWLSSCFGGSFFCGRGRKREEDFSGDISLEAADDLGLGQPLGGASGDVVLGSLVGGHAGDDDAPECAIGGSVSAAVEPVPGRPARRSRQGRHAAQHREGGLVGEAVGILAGRDEHLPGHVGTDAFECEQPGVDLGHERTEQLVEIGDLDAERPVAPSKRAQRDLGGRARIAGTGTVRPLVGADLDQFSVGQRPQLGAQRFRCRDDQRLDLSLHVSAVPDGRTARHPQCPQRLDTTVSLLGQPGAHPGQRGPGRSLGIDGIGFALPPAGLAVGPVDLDHGHALGGQQSGQAGPVDTGALDTDQQQRPEPAQPP